MRVKTLEELKNTDGVYFEISPQGSELIKISEIGSPLNKKTILKHWMLTNEPLPKVEVEYKGKTYEVEESHLSLSAEQTRRDEIEAVFRGGDQIIEFSHKGWGDRWEVKCTDNPLNWTNYDYRIKAKPKYQPFTKADYKEYLGKIVLPKEGRAGNPRIADNLGDLTLSEWFENRTFEDGSVFGKLVK